MAQLVKENYMHIKAGELTFNVYVEGEGEPLILLHGFPDDLTLWSETIPIMVSNGYKVIAFDQRGFGESDAPKGKHHYILRKIVDDIPHLLAQLNINTPVSVMGHDLGSVVGWAFCMFYPKLVKSFVAISVGHIQSYGKAGLYQKLVKGFYVLWFQLPGVSEYYLLHGGFSRWMSGHAKKDEAIAKMSRPGRLTAAINFYRANLMDVVFKQWPRCKVPTLGIWSTGDKYLTEKQMIKSKLYMDAQWSYQRIEGVGHWIPYDAPDKMCEYALDWFQQKR